MEEATVLHTWVRRAAGSDTLFALRFATQGARVVLRMSVDGVLVDGPAVAEGEEGGLTAEQVRASRLVLITPGGRDTVALDRLTVEELRSIEPDAWVPLELLRIDDEAWLELAPPESAPLEAPESDTASTAASVGDLPPTSLGMAPTLPPPDNGDGALLEGTALVRHLRRSLSRERLRAYALERRVGQLEDTLRDHGIEPPPTLAE